MTNKPSVQNALMFKDLCYISSSRGTDATGVAIVQDKKIIIEKAAVKASTFIKENLKSHMNLLSKTRIAIGHTRNKTQGTEKDNNNNHPIHGQKWVMIHNGTCSSMDRIKEYKYKGEVDTEILLSHVETYGLETGLSHLSGYAAVAMLDREDTSSLYLWRHNEDIFLGYDRDSQTLFFASTENILQLGLANELELFTSFQIRKVPEHILFKLQTNPLNIESLCEVEVIKPTYGGYNGYRNYQEWNKSKETKKEETTSTKTTYVYDPTKGYMIPITSQKKGDTTVYEILPVKNKYFFKPTSSSDFQGWKKIGKAHYSIDGKLVKIWDKTDHCHVLMTTEDATKEHLLDYEGGV